MKKILLTVLLVIFTTNFIFSQRGVKIGYIDTEYILQNLAEYDEVNKRLNQKANDWKKEIEEKFRKIEKRKESLNSERILLTDEMINEIEEDITLDEQELSDYQQKRFGPNGDLIVQKKLLIQPIQDQIFNAIKELAKNRDYDFIFDKSADIVMLYSNRRHDISDQILRTITRANNRKKLETRREKKEADDLDIIDNYSEINETINKAEEKNEKLNENEIKPQRKLTVKELLEQRKQKNSNDKKIKDY